MDAPARATDFFKAGGTLHPNSPSYVRRPADDELFRQVMAGQFCYVLTSRQRGKSSLMIRTAERLRNEDIQTVIIDLSGLGTQVTREQWYLGIITRLAVELRLPVESEQWWHEHSALSPAQCFTDFLYEVVLAETQGRIVIFIDEIDSTLRLDFTDDFFVAIRAIYNLRASNHVYERLTFVLLGVAAPGDLIKNRNRTPFNIGYAIDLHDLARDDAYSLQEGLECIYHSRGRDILDRIFYWTGGHPYLTQKLCVEITEAPANDWQDDKIDELVERLFFNEDARSEDNILFIRNSIAMSSERRQILQLYQCIYEDEKVVRDERSSLQNRLRLIGLVRSERDTLCVSNEIYRHIFNPSWIKESIPVNWSQIITMAINEIGRRIFNLPTWARKNIPANWPQIVTISAIAFFVLGLVFDLAMVESRRKQTVEGYKVSFRSFTLASPKMRIMADLCQLDQQEARALFFQQSRNQQLDMFRTVKAQAAARDLNTVVNCLYPSLVESVPETKLRMALSTAMCDALSSSGDAEGKQIRKRIGCDTLSKGELLQL